MSIYGTTWTHIHPYLKASTHIYILDTVIPEEYISETISTIYITVYKVCPWHTHIIFNGT